MAGAMLRELQLLLATRSLRWLDHLARMPDERLSKKMLFECLVSARQVP